MIVKPRSSRVRFLFTRIPLILGFLCASSPIARGDEQVPPIEAKTYETTVLRRSHSMTAYLLDDPENASPKEGKILLLRRNGEAAMAVRVLKTYPEKKQFAAIRVKSYNGFRFLDTDENLQAIEKIADVVFVLPQTAEEKSSILELESQAPPPATLPPPAPAQGETPPPADVTPPGQTPPPPAPQAVQQEPPQDSQDDADPAPATPEDEADELSKIVVQEPEVFEHDRHWVTLTGGFLENGSPNGGGVAYFSGGGLRYGLNIAKDFLLKRGKVQDSLTLEGGAFMYKAFGGNSDSYTIAPLIGTLRYNLYLNDGLGFFLYGGILQNYILSANLPVQNLVQAFQLTLPAFGAGTFFRIGPNWDLRMDFGVDFVGLGLVLRF